MTGRGVGRTGPWWVLVVLAAVFSMHGLQCVAADPMVAHPDASSMSVSPLSAGHVTMDVRAAPPEALPDGTLAAQMSGHAAAGTGHRSHPFAHALAVCLAVLLAGLAVLGGALLLRRVAPSALAGAALAGLRSGVGLPSALRPPDLSALCVLRI